MPKTLLDLVRERQDADRVEHNYGIQTADRFAKTLTTCVGSDLCYRYASTKSTSFADVLKKAANTLTYSNPDLEVKDIYSDAKAISALRDIELPKNTLMVFRNRLTTPRKDRDGDILRTKGARPDPKMLLLWQHVHTLPIGKCLGVAEHTEKNLDLITAIVGINELADDAAVMIENKMLRFSHGFKATEFSAIKEEDGRSSGKGGFDVKQFDIMEESGVSVPANIDGEIVEVYLDLIEGDKLRSSMMKSYGKHLRANQKHVTSSGGFDFGDRTDESTETKSGSDCGCGKPDKCQCEGKESSSSEKADESSDGDEKPDNAKKQKVDCPECGKGSLIDGTCDKCGFKQVEKPRKETPPKKKEDEEEEDDVEDDKIMEEDDVEEEEDDEESSDDDEEEEEEESSDDDEEEEEEEDKTPPKKKPKKKDVGIFDAKMGKVLSKANYMKLKKVAEDLKEMHGQHVTSRSGKALCDKCYKSVNDILSTAGYDGETSTEITAKQAGVEFLKRATSEELELMFESLAVHKSASDQKRQTQALRRAIALR